MANFNQESRMNIDDYDFAQGANDENAPMYVNSLVTKALGNPSLQGEVAQQLQKQGLATFLQGRGLRESRQEVPTRRRSRKVEEGPQERERSNSSHESNDDDVAPRRRRVR